MRPSATQGIRHRRARACVSSYGTLAWLSGSVPTRSINKKAIRKLLPYSLENCRSTFGKIL